MYMHVSYAEYEGLAENENIWCLTSNKCGSTCQLAPGIREAAGTPSPYR